MRCPNTPFATRLSGSAKETQLRIHSIFQWKKKRPPVWLFTFIVHTGLTFAKPDLHAIFQFTPTHV